jgi:hypothetical protein
LGIVDEVTILRFPDNQAFRLLDIVAILETQRRHFRKRAVVDFKGGVGLR